MSTSNSKSKVLITGASGYLGHHLLASLNTFTAEFDIYGIYNTSSSLKFDDIQLSQLDLTDKQQLDSYFTRHGPFDYCLHLAALSTPRVCQAEPDKATAVNVPHYLLQLLGSTTKLIVLSTDQVYGGDKGSPYLETDEPNPLNHYAQTKVWLEQACPNAVILRSSIMLGPKVTGAHDTFLHFVASRDGQETTYFTNECRSVVSVKDVVKILIHFLQHDFQPDIYNMGGPLRVSRYDMALAVANHLKMDTKFVVAAEKLPQEGAVPSPLDITMDSNKLQTVVGFQFQDLMDMVKATFEEGHTRFS
jgi:dTDP-4-dehydrorhamnose reductase